MCSSDLDFATDADKVADFCAKRLGYPLVDVELQSGSFYTAFEEAALNEGSLANAGFEGPWIQEFTALAVENIIPPFVELRGTIELQTSSSEGIHHIRDALLKIEEFSDEKKEISVTCHYDGAPNYRIELKAPDFKTAEKVWENSVQAAINFFREHGGQGKAWRE